MDPVIVRHESGKLRQEIYVGQHHLVADEPLDQGGENSGPSPFDFLASALGACTAITLRMYAQRKAWPLENAEVIVTLTRSDGLTQFNRKITIQGALSGEQKTRLLEIANHCPIHKVLMGKIEIQTTLG